jgi:hypothetical protein
MLKSFKIPKLSKCVNTLSNEESLVTKSSIIDFLQFKITPVGVFITLK